MFTTATPWYRQLAGLSTLAEAIKRLPPETLSLIFEHACPSPDLSDIVKSYDKRGGEIEDRTCHLTLSLVCNHWHQVILGTPRLWTDIILNVGEMAGMAEDWQRLFSDHFGRSGTLPISLEIRFQSGVSAQQEAIVDAVLRHCKRRLRSLVLLDIPESFATSLSYSYPLLEDLAVIIKNTRIEPFPIKVTGAPSLSRFMFWVPKNVWKELDLVLPWSSITHLDISNAPIRTYVETLIRCSNLVDYRSYLEHPREFVEPHRFRADYELTLPQLKSFEWSGSYGGPVDRLLQNIRLPVLESLYLHYERWIYPVPWERFFSKLPPTVTTFTLYEYEGVNAPEEELPYPEFFFEHLPNLRELRLLSCNSSLLDDALEKLGIQDVLPGKRVPKYLPELRSIIARTTSNKEDLEKCTFEIQNQMKKMLHHRYNGCIQVPEYHLGEVIHPTKDEIVYVDIVLQISSSHFS